MKFNLYYLQSLVINKMKQKVTSEDLACLVPALNNILDGAYLVQIYDGSIDNTKSIIMKFRNKVEDVNKTYFGALPCICLNSVASVHVHRCTQNCTPRVVASIL